MGQTHRVSGVATKIGSSDGYQFVQYHSTKVVRWNDSEIILNSGGWLTHTTKTRMNQTASQFELGFNVYQKKFGWFVSYQGQELPFSDNMKLQRSFL